MVTKKAPETYAQDSPGRPGSTWFPERERWAKSGPPRVSRSKGQTHSTTAQLANDQGHLSEDSILTCLASPISVVILSPHRCFPALIAGARGGFGLGGGAEEEETWEEAEKGWGGGASYILLEKGTDQEVNSSLTPAMLAWR